MPRHALHRAQESASRSTLRPTALAAAAALAALGGMAGLPAAAQTAPAPRPAASNELTTITVTANRRVEDQQKVAVAVTALSGEALAERNVVDLSAMEGLVPGFTFGRSGADARPAIRGVRTENVAVNADTTIGFFVDGIYKSRAQQAMLGFVDVERVEVQRGPQGTLFGRNTFGGNIAITTNAPQFRNEDRAASLTLGNFSRTRFEGVINAPVGDQAALRVAGAVERADPWVRNDFNPAAGQFDQDLKYARIAFRSRPMRELEVVLRADLTSQNALGGSAFGYKQSGTYVHTPSCQQLFNATLTTLNVRPGNRDAVNDCTRTQGAGAGTGASAIGSAVDLGIPLYRAGDLTRIDNDQQTFLRTNDTNFSAEISWKLPSMTLKSITGFADFASERSSDSDFSASTIAIDYQRTAAATLTQEFQLLSEGGGPLGYVAGVYFFRDELEGKFINQQLPRTIRSAAAAALTLPQNGAGFYDLQRPDTRSTALYGQLSWKLSEAFTLTAGARYTRDEKSFRYANANAVLPQTAPGVPDGTQITLATATPPESAFGVRGVSNCTGGNAQPGFACLPGTNTITGATYNDATFSKGTGRLSLDWRVAPASLLYATASTGFRSGGFNSAQVLETVRTFKPEEVRALEIGSKNRFFGNTLQLNVAAFANRYTNLQEQRQVPIGATTVSTIFNAAKAKANGLEIETQWRPSAALSLGASIALLDAKYTSFPDVALPFGTSILVTDPGQATAQTDANGVVIAPAGQRRIFAPGYSCRVVPGTGGAGQPAAAFGCDLSGKRLPYSPERTLGFFVKYDLPLGQGTLTPLVQVNYSSGFFGQPTNAEIERQPAYTKVDFKLNWRVSDTFSVQAYVDNLGDKQTINRFVWGGGGALQISAAPPRTFGMRLAYSNF